MPRRPARVTQADIARAIRAAKEAGASAVTIDGEGAIRIALAASTLSIRPTNHFDQEWTPSEPLQRFLKRTESG
jgi:hypothetical protein